MLKAFMLIMTLISINHLLHAETNKLNTNKILEPFIFEIGSNFSEIQTKFSLEAKTSGANFIKESNEYILKHQ